MRRSERGFEKFNEESRDPTDDEQIDRIHYHSPADFLGGRDESRDDELANGREDISSNGGQTEGIIDACVPTISKYKGGEGGSFMFAANQAGQMTDSLSVSVSPPISPPVLAPSPPSYRQPGNRMGHFYAGPNISTVTEEDSADVCFNESLSVDRDDQRRETTSQVSRDPPTVATHPKPHKSVSTQLLPGHTAEVLAQLDLKMNTKTKQHLDAGLSAHDSTENMPYPDFSPDLNWKRDSGNKIETHMLSDLAEQRCSGNCENIEEPEAIADISRQNSSWRSTRLPSSSALHDFNVALRKGIKRSALAETFPKEFIQFWQKECTDEFAVVLFLNKTEGLLQAFEEMESVKTDLKIYIMIERDLLKAEKSLGGGRGAKESRKYVVTLSRSKNIINRLCKEADKSIQRPCGNTSQQEGRTKAGINSNAEDHDNSKSKLPFQTERERQKPWYSVPNIISWILPFLPPWDVCHNGRSANEPGNGGREQRKSIKMTKQKMKKSRRKNQGTEIEVIHVPTENNGTSCHQRLRIAIWINGRRVYEEEKLVSRGYGDGVERSQVLKSSTGLLSPSLSTQFLLALDEASKMREKVKEMGNANINASVKHSGSKQGSNPGDDQALISVTSPKSALPQGGVSSVAQHRLTLAQLLEQNKSILIDRTDTDVLSDITHNDFT